MLIDVSRKPLIIFPEECTSSIVVRSVGNRTVSGLVSHWSGDKKAVKNLVPGASLMRGGATCYETKLPLVGGYYASKNRMEARMNALTIGSMSSVEPFEVASAFTDILTKLPGTWRAAIRVEYLPLKLKKAPWVVSVLNVTTGEHLSSIAVSGLDTDSFVPDVLPLKKLMDQTDHQITAWSHILDCDED